LLPCAALARVNRTGSGCNTAKFVPPLPERPKVFRPKRLKELVKGEAEFRFFASGKSPSIHQVFVFRYNQENSSSDNRRTLDPVADLSQPQTLISVSQPRRCHQVAASHTNTGDKPQPRKPSGQADLFLFPSHTRVKVIPTLTQVCYL
jgi:hypothetical protein